MEQTKANRPKLTQEQRFRIQAFCNDLRLLCNKHNVDIDGSEYMPGWIGIQDRAVPETAPARDYARYEALISGVNETGTYRDTADGFKPGIMFETYADWGK